MEISGKKISILGAVRSGVSAAKLALEKGALPFVSDFSLNDELELNRTELLNMGIPCEIGGHSEKVFDCDFIITSPGVPSDSPVLTKAAEKRIRIISELEFAAAFCKGNIIGITGTNGKTTTASLCAHVIGSAGYNCWLAGNIGLPFSEIASDIEAEDYVALEISSFQLDFIENFKPKFAVILNITPDHLDRYQNRFDLYIKSKMKISKNQGEGDFFIFNADDDNIPIGYVSNKTRLLSFSLDKNISSGSFLDEDWIVYSGDGEIKDICKISDLSLKGEHNIMNCMAVIDVAVNIGIEPEKIKSSLGAFKGVEHRLEFVSEINGVKVINDSKATNVDSVWYALRSFDSDIYLILGGKDKGNDYNKIKDEVKSRVKKIYAIGSSAGKVYEFFKNVTAVEIIDDFENCVRKGISEAGEGSIFLLSPACASFDMFRNYEDRGEQFKKIVNSLK
jgi:UDP-N-acetylmuramoylalanine--D-glutamate ligase